MYKPKTCLQGKLAMFMFTEKNRFISCNVFTNTLQFLLEAHDSEGYCQMGVSHIEVCHNSLLFR